MLQHSFKRRVNALPEDFIKSLKEPEKFLSSDSKYVKLISKIGENKYRVVFEWKKFGIKKRIDVNFKVIAQDPVIKYVSTSDSNHYASISFIITRDPEEDVFDLEVHAEIDAGALAGFLGKKDFQKFMEDLVDKSIRKFLLERVRAKKLARISCKDCVFYEASRHYCYALKRQVRTNGHPPCGGKLFERKKKVSSPDKADRRGSTRQ